MQQKIPDAVIQTLPIFESYVPLYELCQNTIGENRSVNELEVGNFTNSVYFEKVWRLLFNLSNSISGPSKLDEFLTEVLEYGYQNVFIAFLSMQTASVKNAAESLLRLLILRREKATIDRIQRLHGPFTLNWCHILYEFELITAGIGSREFFDGQDDYIGKHANYKRFFSTNHDVYDWERVFQGYDNFQVTTFIFDNAMAQLPQQLTCVNIAILLHHLIRYSVGVNLWTIETFACTAGLDWREIENEYLNLFSNHFFGYPLSSCDNCLLERLLGLGFREGLQYAILEALIHSDSGRLLLLYPYCDLLVIDLDIKMMLWKDKPHFDPPIARLLTRNTLESLMEVIDIDERFSLEGTQGKWLGLLVTAFLFQNLHLANLIYEILEDLETHVADRRQWSITLGFAAFLYGIEPTIDVCTDTQLHIFASVRRFSASAICSGNGLRRRINSGEKLLTSSIMDGGIETETWKELSLSRLRRIQPQLLSIEGIALNEFQVDHVLLESVKWDLTELSNTIIACGVNTREIEWEEQSFLQIVVFYGADFMVLRSLISAGVQLEELKDWIDDREDCFFEHNLQEWHDCPYRVILRIRLRPEFLLALETSDYELAAELWEDRHIFQPLEDPDITFSLIEALGLDGICVDESSIVYQAAFDAVQLLSNDSAWTPEGFLSHCIGSRSSSFLQALYRFGEEKALRRFFETSSDVGKICFALEPVQERTLTCAVASGHLGCVKVLIENGADPNYRERLAKNGMLEFAVTNGPLCLAVEARDFEITRYLVEHGANIDVKGTSSRTSYYLDCMSPLRMAVQANMLDFVALMLNFDPSPSSSKRALEFAIKYDRTALAGYIRSVWIEKTTTQSSSTLSTGSEMSKKLHTLLCSKTSTSPTVR